MVTYTQIESISFDVPSKNGKPAIYTLRSHSEPSVNLLVSFPGMAYSMDAPLMWYTSLSALEAGYDVLGLEYSFQVRGNPGFNLDIETVVEEISDGLEKFLKEHSYRNIVFLSKSIGTVIAPGVSEKMKIVPHASVFLTPLERMLHHINSSKKVLSVIGDRDPAFPSRAVDQIKDRNSLMLVAGANHSLEIPGSAAESIEIMGKIVERCKRFLEEARE